MSGLCAPATTLQHALQGVTHWAAAAHGRSAPHGITPRNPNSSPLEWAPMLRVALSDTRHAIRAVQLAILDTSGIPLMRLQVHQLRGHRRT